MKDGTNECEHKIALERSFLERKLDLKIRVEFQNDDQRRIAVSKLRLSLYLQKKCGEIA